MTPAFLALAGGLVLDGAVGELPNRLHPVAWLGRVVAPFDRRWDRPQIVGGVVALAVPLLAAGGVGLGIRVLGRVSPLVAAIGAALVVFVTTSLRHLLGTVREVCGLAETDLAEARTSLSALAGRDATDLSPGEVRSAALESLAENYVDGLVAPLFWFVAGATLVSLLDGSATVALSFACAGAVWIKAVNTLDSMLGYPEKPWGTGSARLDDAAMWLPARLGAGMLALALGSPRALRRARSWNSGVPSPNSGWPMGVLAAGLDVRLAKPGQYDLNSTAALPDASHVDRALRRVGLAALLAFGIAGVVTWY